MLRVDLLANRPAVCRCSMLQAADLRHLGAILTAMVSIPLVSYNYKKSLTLARPFPKLGFLSLSPLLSVSKSIHMYKHCQTFQ